MTLTIPPGTGTVGIAIKYYTGGSDGIINGYDVVLDLQGASERGNCC